MNISLASSIKVPTPPLQKVIDYLDKNWGGGKRSTVDVHSRIAYFYANTNDLLHVYLKAKNIDRHLEMIIDLIRLAEQRSAAEVYSDITGEYIPDWQQAIDSVFHLEELILENDDEDENEDEEEDNQGDIGIRVLERDEDGEND